MSNVVVVGYDQSAHSNRALAEAAHEAAARGARLRIVNAYRWPGDTGALTRPGLSRQECTAAAEQIVTLAASAVRAMHPGIEAEALAVPGHAGAALLEASQDAELLVVGRRGRGGFDEQLLGSVSLRVLAGAQCPVIVAHSTDRPTRNRVVAAVDIDRPCDPVLDFAFATAQRRKTALTVIHVWDEPWFLPVDESSGLIKSTTPFREERTARLDDLVRPWQTKCSDVPLTQLIGIGPAGAGLIAAAREVDLLIVGAQRHGGGLPGMRIGPVVHTALHHAQCPVAVVPLD